MKNKEKGKVLRVPKSRRESLLQDKIDEKNRIGNTRGSLQERRKETFHTDRLDKRHRTNRKQKDIRKNSKNFTEKLIKKGPMTVQDDECPT